MSGQAKRFCLEYYRALWYNYSTAACSDAS